MVGLALCARVLLPGLENPALAIPALARHLGHPWVFQLVCLALLSVLLSTADSVADDRGHRADARRAGPG